MYIVDYDDVRGEMEFLAGFIIALAVGLTESGRGR